MKVFESCHLIVNDHRHIHDFINRYLLFWWRGTSTPFLRCTSSTNANISTDYDAHAIDAKPPVFTGSLPYFCSQILELELLLSDFLMFSCGSLVRVC